MDLERITDEEYFGALKEMFLTKGWEIFIAEMVANAININSVEETNTEHDLFFRKGQLAVLGNILNTESTITLAEKEASEDSK